MIKISLFTTIITWTILLTGCAPQYDKNELSDTTPLEAQTVWTDFETEYPRYRTYDAGEQTKDQFEWRKSVLFFWSQECASCESLNADIISNVAEIPENISIYTVEYDQYTDLAEAYRVRSPDTVVMVHDQNSFSSMNWLKTLDNILSSLWTKTISISSTKLSE